jgi:hypothetical protein
MQYTTHMIVIKGKRRVRKYRKPGHYTVLRLGDAVQASRPISHMIETVLTPCQLDFSFN